MGEQPHHRGEWTYGRRLALEDRIAAAIGHFPVLLILVWARGALCAQRLVFGSSATRPDAVEVRRRALRHAGELDREGLLIGARWSRQPRQCVGDVIVLAGQVAD